MFPFGRIGSPLSATILQRLTNGSSQIHGRAVQSLRSRILMVRRGQLENRPPSIPPALLAFVRDDREEPRAMIRAFAQARKGAPGFECSLLYRVFTVVCVLQHSIGEALGGRDQRRHQVGERPVLIGLG